MCLKKIIEMSGKKMKDVKITIRLPIQLKEKLQQEADSRGITLHDLVMIILWEDLKCKLPK